MRGGGDVRLLSYQAGHNSLHLIPDPYVTEFFPASDDADTRCGAKINTDASNLAWFNQYLKGQANAASIIPTQPCVSLSIGDKVLIEGTGAYTTTYAAVAFNGFPPLQQIVI